MLALQRGRVIAIDEHAKQHGLSPSLGKVVVLQIKDELRMATGARHDRNEISISYLANAFVSHNTIALLAHEIVDNAEYSSLRGF